MTITADAYKTLQAEIKAARKTYRDEATPLVKKLAALRKGREAAIAAAYAKAAK